MVALGREARGSSGGRSRQFRRSTLLSAAGAGVCALCWLPLHLSVLLPIGLALTLAGYRATTDTRDAARAGAAWGAVYMAVGAHFLLVLVRYSPLGAGFYALAILYGVPFGLVSFALGRWLERCAKIPSPAGLLVTFPLVEWLRSVGDLSLPADTMAHGLADWPAFLVLSSVGGPQLILVWSLCCGLLLLRGWDSRATPPRAALWVAAATSLWCVPPAVDALTVARRDHGAPKVAVAIVQPAFSLRDKRDPRRAPVVRQRLERLTREAAQGADLVIWPESARATPLVLEDGEPPRDPQLQALSEEVETPILYGTEIAVESDGRLRRLYNGVALVRPEGGDVDWYAKQRLLPLAEGLPFAGPLGLDPAERLATPQAERSMLTLLGVFSPGPGPVVFEVAGLRIGTLICYESLYPKLSRDYAARGADTLTIVTNDAWWGHSAFAWRHARLAAARARETGLPIVRAANDGLSMHLDSKGRVASSTRLDEVTTLRVEVRPGVGRRTLFARWGNWPVAALLVALAALALRALALSQRARAAGAQAD